MMNPLPVTCTMLRHHRVTLALFITLIAFAVALGLSVSAVERALRQGSARASDPFDLVVGASGSATDLIFAAVYLQTGALPLIPPDAVAGVLAAEGAHFAAPLAFGDRHGHHPVIGTTADLVAALSPTLAEGRPFATRSEAVAGARADIAVGTMIQPSHAHGDIEGLPVSRLTVVGRMAPTGTPWDDAIVVPVEQYWETHNLPAGHQPGSDAIGPPFDPDYLAGVPAIVIDAANIGAAYGLRNQFRGGATTAVFPAEVLSEIYGFMADGRDALLWLVAATQALSLLAVLAGLLLVVQLHARRIALLRALGASRLFVALAIWGFAFAVIGAGVVLGCVGGVAATVLLARFAADLLGIAMPVSLSPDDMGLVMVCAEAAVLFAILPALAIYRRGAIEVLGD